MKVLNIIALTLVILGGLNWLSVGAFGFDAVAYLFGGPLAPAARVIYALIGVAALYCIGFYRFFAVTGIPSERYHNRPVASHM